MGNGQAKEDKVIEEIATKETYLECPVLVDLDHGTIRHRHEEITSDTGPKKIGYFYHPKLNDFSEDALISCGENNRLKYVFEGPPKDSGKRLYYIYGTDQTAKDKGITHDEYRPQGKGYNWPQSFRKANNLYYDVLFVENVKDDGDPSSVHEFGSDTDSTQSSGILVNKKNPQQKDLIKLKLRPAETVGSIIERVSLQLLIPSSNIHLLWDKNELSKDEKVIDLNTKEEMKDAPFYTIMLRLT